MLAFLHKNPGKIPSELTDPENAAKLTAFRKKIESSKRLVKYWTTADNLRADVQAALSYAFESRPRTGWVRADSSQNAAQLKEQLEQANRIIKDKQKEINLLQRECKTVKAELEKSRENETALQTQLAKLEKSRENETALQIQLVPLTPH